VEQGDTNNFVGQSVEKFGEQKSRHLSSSSNYNNFTKTQKIIAINLQSKAIFIYFSYCTNFEGATPPW